MAPFPTRRILNLDLHDCTLAALLPRLRTGIVFTPNVDHLMRLQRDQAFYQTYQVATHRLCDSRIIQLTAGWTGGAGFEAQVAGSDLLPALCRYQGETEGDLRLFLLGGKDEAVATAAQARLNALAGRPVVVGAYAPPFGFEADPAEASRIYDRIRASGATAVAVGVGSPKQEHWIAAHHAALPEVQLWLAVGAAIDFQGGGQQRAPRWMQRAGLEWAYRLGREPRRLWRRYLVEGLPYFRLLWQQRRGRYRDPWAGSS